jgi:uncharacterized protein DUF2865
MAACGNRSVLRVSAGIVAAGLLTFATLAPASAGFFDRLFSGLFRGPSQQQRSDTVPASGYCVRTCDGHFFPVRAQGDVSAADVCRSFCPASETKIYSGSGIDNAVATDGSSYEDLDTAFLYRQQTVAGCTCNGRTPFGLAQVDVGRDPSLRPGDVVATSSGFVAATGNRGKVAGFTPIDGNRAVPNDIRQKLSNVKIAPPAPAVAATAPPSTAGQNDERQRSAFEVAHDFLGQ